jgi:integrase
MLTRYFEPWQHRRLSNLTRKDIILLHGQLGERTPYAANRIVALVRKMFNLARLWGVYDGDNPATGIELFPEEKRDRFIQPHELPKLFEALNAEPNPYVKTALLVALLTGARRGEVLACAGSMSICLKRSGAFPIRRADGPTGSPCRNQS